MRLLTLCLIHVAAACSEIADGPDGGDGDGQRLSFVSGGPLADAIMLAMLTAPRHDEVPRLLRRSLGGAS